MRQAVKCLDDALLATKISRFYALSDAAIGAVLGSLDFATSVHQYRLGIRLLAQTLVRPTELLGAKWADIDLESGFWLIKYSKHFTASSSTGRRLPLSRQARETLRSMQELRMARLAIAPSESVGYVLVPSFYDHTVAASSDSLGKVMRRAVDVARIRGVPVGSATLPSLRKSGVGWLLNHTDKPSLVDRLAGSPLSRSERELSTSYDPERNLSGQRDLLQMWADHLDRCLSIK